MAETTARIFGARCIRHQVCRAGLRNLLEAPGRPVRGVLSLDAPDARAATGPVGVKRPARLLSAVGIAAILLVAVADATLGRNTGCSPNAHFGLVRSLYHGDPRIDRYHWQTCDKSWTQNHFYATKAPLLAVASLPF